MKKNTVFVLLFLGNVWAVFAQKIFSQDSFAGAGIQAIEVEGRFCEIIIQSTEGTTSTTFTGEIKGKKPNYTFQIKHQVTGSLLKVWVESSEAARDTNEVEEDYHPNSFRNITFSHLRGRLTFNIPKNTSVQVKNRSGNITVKGISGDKIHLQTSSGTIRAQDIVGNPYFKLTSGRLLVENVQGNIEAVSRSGAQHWTNIAGDLTTRASSGRILLNQIKGNVSAKASSGSIHLGNASGQMRLSTSSGRIIGEKVTLTADSEFKASSGSIKVTFNNALEDFKFDCKAASGNVRVGKSTRYNTLQENKGKITVVGSTHSGRQRYSGI